jgi:phosphoglycolate phosphatase
MKYKGIIFDLDGTLLDTLEDIASSANLVLEHFGKTPLPLDNYRYLVGEGAMRLMEKALGEDTKDSLEAFALFKEIYAARWDATTKPYDGIEQMLQEMEGVGLRLGVLSNKPNDFVGECVERYFPKINFLHVAGERANINRKPDPAGAFIALEALHVKANEACFVGDTKIDMQTAKAANIDAFGVAWGFRDAKELYEHGALNVFENANSLKAYVLG